MTLHKKIHVEYLERPPYELTAKGIEMISIVLQLEDRPSQRKIAKIMSISKGYCSRIKKSLVELSWLAETDFGNGLELYIPEERVDDVKMILAQYQKMKQSVWVRVHGILCDTTSESDSERVVTALEKLTTKGFKVVISPFGMGKQYSVKTSKGTIIFRPWTKTGKIQMYISDVNLLLKKDDTDYYEYYTTNAIEQKIMELYDYIIDNIGSCKLRISKIISLKYLEIGLCVKKEIAKALSLTSKLEQIGIQPDNSVCGFEEYEVRGSLDEVLERSKEALNLILKAIEETYDSGD